MNYAYIRVSSDKQTTENQRFEIEQFTSKRSLEIDKWVDETISSMADMKNRSFGKLLKKLKEGDTLIVSEISRIGRSIMQIMGILNLCMERKIKVISIKEGYELGDNIVSKVLAFAFGLSAEIERTLISQRIKEALARKKANGVQLGRPLGSKKKTPLLQQYHDRIVQMVCDGINQADMARALKCHRHTIRDYIALNISVEEL